MMCYSLNSPSHGLYRPPVQNYSRFRTASVFDDCSRAEARPTTHAVLFFEGGICLQYCTLRRVYVFDQAVLLLPCWTNNHCPRPGLNVVIKHYWPSYPPPLYTRHFLSSVCNF